MKLYSIRHNLVRHFLSLVILSVMVAAAFRVIAIPLLPQIENIAYDFRVRLTASQAVDPRVVIVDIDEKSLREVGRWPWNRDIMARMVDNLFQHYQISVLGFDVVFAEAENNSALTTLNQLATGELADDARFVETVKNLTPQLQNDVRFAKSLEDRPVSLGYFFYKTLPSTLSRFLGAIPAPILTLEELGFPEIPFVTAQGYGGNLAELQAATLSGGFFDNPLVDEDGVFRRVPLLTLYKGGLYPSLPLSMVRSLLGEPPLTFGPGATWLEVGKHRIPVALDMSILVPFRGRQGSFPYVSASDILDKRVDAATLRGAMVLVGTSAAGLNDLRSTPVQNVYPGVEIHANIISGILDGRIKEFSPIGWMIDLAILSLSWLILALFLPRLSLFYAMLLSTILYLLMLAGNLFAWDQGLVLPLANNLFMVSIMFTLHTAYGFFVEAQGKKQISRMFGQYVPGELVEEMSASGQEISIGGESREMTVLFSDVRGFTTISEGLKPDELTRLMNAFLTPMTRVIHQHRGTIDKYMGDAIMAFWGAPIADPDHARHGVLAALEMIRVMNALKSDFQSRGWPPLKIGVGLNTGLMNVGNMGSEFRMAYTVLGDAVNLGSRLESLSKQYGASIIVGEETFRRVSGMIYRRLDRVRVKGKDEPVAIYEPVGLPQEVSPELLAELDSYHAALDLYLEQRWDEAESALRELQRLHPEKLIYEVYLSRITHFREESPGEAWDGVYTHTSK
ncbi:MAG: adenylate/guanylate cyclase domain-containing protein [Magnetococcales bacterium]|nr:adenylate/guanylate cyclase domain-containing protein [Magnetococcales bacterium]